MAKLYDLAVVVGSYTNRNGDEKKRWKNIGSVLETKDGGKVILIDRIFNPAGVPVEDGRDQIMISMLKPKDGETEQSAPRSESAPAQNKAAHSPGSFDDFHDDIPF